MSIEIARAMRPLWVGASCVCAQRRGSPIRGGRRRRLSVFRVKSEKRSDGCSIGQVSVVAIKATGARPATPPSIWNPTRVSFKCSRCGNHRLVRSGDRATSRPTHPRDSCPWVWVFCGSNSCGKSKLTFPSGMFLLGILFTLSALLNDRNAWRR